MAGITLEQAQQQLDIWLAADTAVAGSQSYEITAGGTTRRLTRADAAEIRQRIEFWDAKVKQMTPAVAGGRMRTSYVVPE